MVCRTWKMRPLVASSISRYVSVGMHSSRRRLDSSSASVSAGSRLVLKMDGGQATQSRLLVKLYSCDVLDTVSTPHSIAKCQ